MPLLITYLHACRPVRSLGAIAVRPKRRLVSELLIRSYSVLARRICIIRLNFVPTAGINGSVGLES